jgi:hypothetical protein
MTKGISAPDEPADSRLSAPPARAQTVIWIHDGPVCVTVVDQPPPHLTNGVCRCAACGGAHEPDRAVRFF